MKKPSKPSSARAFSAAGTPLHGTAAQLRLISLAGGWDKYQKDLMTGAANEAVSQLWLKVVTNYTLVPYRETPPQGQGAHTGAAESHAGKIPGASNFTSLSSPHVSH